MYSETAFTVFEDAQPMSLLLATSSAPNSIISLLSTSNTGQPTDLKLYKQCNKNKNKAEFYTGQIPLAEVDINTLEGVKLATMCRTCREKIKIQNGKRTAKRRKKNDERKMVQMNVSRRNDEEIQTLFEQRYPSRNCSCLL
jgi:hypothetical protein